MEPLSCNSCGAQNPADANFCGTCGSPLIGSTCPFCSKEISKDWKFCKYCGYNLTVKSISKQEETRKKPEAKKAGRKQVPAGKSSGKGGLLKKGLLGAAGILVLLIAFILWPSGNSPEYGKGYALSPRGTDIVETEKYGPVVQNQVVVLLSEEGAGQGYEIADSVGGRVTGYLELIDLYQINVTADSVADTEKAVQSLKQDSRVELAFLNTPVKGRSIEGQPCLKLNPFRGNAIYENAKIKKGSEMVGIKKMWDLVKRSNIELHPVHLGIADEGINKDASELNGLEIEGDLYSAYSWSRFDNEFHKYLTKTIPREYCSKLPVKTMGKELQEQQV